MIHMEERREPRLFASLDGDHKIHFRCVCGAPVTMHAWKREEDQLTRCACGRAYEWSGVDQMRVIEKDIV